MSISSILNAQIQERVTEINTEINQLIGEDNHKQYNLGVNKLAAYSVDLINAESAEETTRIENDMAALDQANLALLGEHADHILELLSERHRLRLKLGTRKLQQRANPTKQLILDAVRQLPTNPVPKALMSLAFGFPGHCLNLELINTRISATSIVGESETLTFILFDGHIVSMVQESVAGDKNIPILGFRYKSMLEFIATCYQSSDVTTPDLTDADWANLMSDSGWLERLDTYAVSRITLDQSN